MQNPHLQLIKEVIMSKKSHFTVKSNERCKVCGVQLKKNLVDKKPNANMCYKCYGEANPHDNIGRGYRKNPSSKYFPG